jgi:hypothetical protein
MTEHTINKLVRQRLAAMSKPLLRRRWIYPRLPEWAQIQHGAASAGRVAEETTALAVEHQRFVIDINYHKPFQQRGS